MCVFVLFLLYDPQIAHEETDMLANLCVVNWVAAFSNVLRYCTRLEWSCLEQVNYSAFACHLAPAPLRMTMTMLFEISFNFHFDAKLAMV